MKKHVNQLLSLFAVASLLAGCASGTSGGSATGGGKAVVEFVHPESYTDVVLSGRTPQQSRDALLPDLEKYIHEKAAKYVPTGEILTLKILDIDMAGLIVSGRGGQTRSAFKNHPARISFEYALTDASGHVLKSGSENLSRLASSFDSYTATDTGMSMIKKMLGDWMSRVAKP